MSLVDLGRRAVACKHWRWMPGMRIVNPQRATFGHGRKAAARYCTLGLNDEAFILESKNAGSMDAPSKNEEDWHPDLEDPATLGCLLALVRQAWPEEWHQFMVPIFNGMGHWYMGCMMQGTSKIIMPTRVMQNGLPDTIPPKRTEAEALVAALEAAP